MRTCYHIDYYPFLRLIFFSQLYPHSKKPSSSRQETHLIFLPLSFWLSRFYTSISFPSIFLFSLSIYETKREKNSKLPVYSSRHVLFLPFKTPRRASLLKPSSAHIFLKGNTTNASHAPAKFSTENGSKMPLRVINPPKEYFSPSQ